MTTNLPVHPVADLFPMLADDELAELAADIAERGLLQPIVLDTEGRVLDGRNRLAACEIAGVEPRFETYSGDDPDGYALAVNGQRRSMTKSQKALVGAELVLSTNRQHGDQTTAAKALGVSEGLVRQAISITKWARDLREQIMLTGKGFAEAREVAAERQEAREVTEAKLQRLADNAPDLAALADEGRMSLDDATAALDAREEKARQEAEAKTAKETAEQARQERDHREAVQRSADRLRSFLHGYRDAWSLADDPNRDDALDALSEFDRDRLLQIEKETTWPSTLI